MGLLVENPVYKPFRYPWCYEAWLTQQRMHWLPEEVPLGDDVRDWQKNLSQAEKNLLTQIFRFFTQADVEVNNCYLRHYTTVFKPTEVLMMMTAFASMETVHVVGGEPTAACSAQHAERRAARTLFALLIINCVC